MNVSPTYGISPSKHVKFSEEILKSRGEELWGRLEQFKFMTKAFLAKSQKGLWPFHNDHYKIQWFFQATLRVSP